MLNLSSNGMTRATCMVWPISWTVIRILCTDGYLRTPDHWSNVGLEQGMLYIYELWEAYC